MTQVYVFKAFLWGGLGFLETSKSDGIKTSYLGTGEGGSGHLSTSNAGGKQTSYLGTAEGGVGKLSTYNVNGKMTGYFGTNKNSDGMGILFDRYGDEGWFQSGKQ